ncbi:MAG: phospholipid carrier-dependent glycosyltransferase [Rhodobacteraceae bacterium]|nr:phospholipid carrier-dependent glycosyltransferase [Paracoccaceae bacterium]
MIEGPGQSRLLNTPGVGARQRRQGMAQASLPPLTVTLVVFAALHLWLALHLPLVADETYYALWATAPAAGYYDHPPMIAWWIWAGERLFGPTALGVRLVSVLAFAALTPLVGRMARIATGGDRRAGRIAALFVNAMALVLVLGFTATPDSPSVFFWALTLWAAMEAVADPARAGRWWLLAGLAAGLGVLSKFTNLFLWVGLVGWLVATADGRAMLRRPVVWAAAALALAVLIPYARWNLAHDGLGLTRQFGRIDSGTSAGLRWLLDYLGTSIALVTPLILMLIPGGVQRARGGARLILWLTAPLVLYMAIHAIHAQVQANWLVPLYPGLAVLAALAARERPDRATLLAAATGIAIGLGALALAFAPGAPVFPGPNTPNETKGWSPVLADLRAAMQASGARWIATDTYGLTGRFSFALPGVPVWSVVEPQRYLFRGPIPARLCAAPGLLVTLDTPQSDVLARFATHGTGLALERRAGGALLQRYTATPVQGLAGCGTTP